MADIREYLEGKFLYGDDFGFDEIAAWFRDEEEGYANLGAKDKSTYVYGYHALNFRHGFRYLKGRRFKRLLGFGSAYGDELRPVLTRVDSVTIVDPSSAFSSCEIMGVPVTYEKPGVDGTLPFEADTFDLITCLAVLHHIPNVSFVMRELSRVTSPGGYMLLREPIVSLGDWTRPRRGLTKRERGIPLNLLISIAESSGFEVVKKSLCMFPTTPRLFKWRRQPTYNSPIAVILDSLVSSVFAWNVNYHPTSAIEKLRPTAAFLILRKSINLSG